MPGKHAPAEIRFWRHVTKSDGCWEWRGSRNPQGYGHFKADSRKPPVKASRFSWVLHYGPIPDGLLACHHCDNPPCVRPDHLFLGTSADNMADMVAKGRSPVHGPDSDLISRIVERQRKLADGEIRRALEQVAVGESCRSVARRLGVAHTTITRLVRGEQWRNHPARDMVATTRVFR